MQIYRMKRKSLVAHDNSTTLILSYIFLFSASLLLHCNRNFGIYLHISVCTWSKTWRAIIFSSFFIFIFFCMFHLETVIVNGRGRMCLVWYGGNISHSQRVCTDNRSTPRLERARTEREIENRIVLLMLRMRTAHHGKLNVRSTIETKLCTCVRGSTRNHPAIRFKIYSYTWNSCGSYYVSFSVFFYFFLFTDTFRHDPIMMMIAQKLQFHELKINCGAMASPPSSFSFAAIAVYTYLVCARSS